MSQKLSDLLVSDGTWKEGPPEQLEAWLERLRGDAEGGASPRVIDLGPNGVLVDLGPDQGPRGVRAGGRVIRSEETVLLWLSAGLGRPSVNLEVAPALARVSSELGQDPETQKLDESIIRNLLHDKMINDPLLVEQAVTPLSYRIYPDTPVTEIAQLMLRRNVRAVPVIGPDRELLGVITSGDILPHVLPAGEGEASPPQTARDIMTRSVLCVSEEQPLLEASRAMVNRGVAQLPVVREGELIGLLERATVIRAFAEDVEVPH